MKSILIILLSLPLALALASCSKPSSGESSRKSEPSGDDYPLSTCVVSGKELGSMGKPVVMVHHGTVVKLCCKGCIPEFKKDIDAFIAKLKQ